MFKYSNDTDVVLMYLFFSWIQNIETSNKTYWDP